MNWHRESFLECYKQTEKKNQRQQEAEQLGNGSINKISINISGFHLLNLSRICANISRKMLLACIELNKNLIG